MRLPEVDSPERGQPYYRAAGDALSDLCYWQEAIVDWRGERSWKRIVARVECQGKDAGTEQVRGGWAWFSVDYGKDPALKALELQARAEKRGLWIDPNPIPPWVWRKMKRSAP